jgi:hypothetical protein
MNAIAKVFTGSAFEARSDVKEDYSFTVVALLCAVGFLASLCVAAYGPDLGLGMSAGFYQ